MYARMLTESSIGFLKRLLDTPGPSGFESAPAKVWRDEARGFAEVSNDVAGNSMAVVNPSGAPTIMLAGHIDEIDIGATSRDDAEKLVSVGDPGVIDSRTIDFPNNCIVSRSIDDRIGAFIVLEAVRRYASQPGAARVVAVATTQEEIAFQGGGARVSATRVAPQMAIVVDVTHATDYPGAEKKEHGHHKIGGGPVLTRGSIVSPVVYALLRDAATRLSVPYTIHAAGRESWTDADAIHVAREGIATALLSIPNRYMHSP